MSRIFGYLNMCIRCMKYLDSNMICSSELKGKDEENKAKMVMQTRTSINIHNS